MKKLRVIARLDIKNNTVVKGIHLEGLRVVGRPDELADRYYSQGVDELLYVDAVASLYERNSLTEIIKAAARRVFVPMTVGGGIRKIEDITEILHSGADKVAVNTAAIRNPEFLRQAVHKFGSQCIVLSVQAKRRGPGQWEAYTETGRERTHRDAIAWIREALALGVGEVLLTSVDAEGTKKGFDLELVAAAARVCAVPLIVSGGAGSAQHLVDVLRTPGVDAVAMASVLHYGLLTIGDAKSALRGDGLEVRL
ncbi:MAG: imidazole glycerol phosphate synthase subunit HisF [Elusimicrobia bacterium]|nr:imidazole glycerol phosphate synthase subunit HisF [Elusimicrobiota bacterium]